jgi:Fic family protein
MTSTIDSLIATGTVPLPLVNQLSRLDECRGREALYTAQQAEALERLVDVARIQSTEASNAIEGITAPTARIKALVEDRSTPRNRSEAEIAGYRSALDLIHSSHEHMPLTSGVTQQLHRTMLQFTGDEGGRLKGTDNTIEEVLPDGSRRVRFQPVPAWQTAEAMTQLHEQTAAALARRALHPALIVGSLVLDFTCIHPFLDGNGRVSRLLTLLGLYKGGYGVGRYVSLERVIADSKETYYEALGASSTNWHEGSHDPIPWLEYFTGILLVAYDTFESNVATLSTHRGAKAEAITNFINAREVPIFTVADIRLAVPTASDAHIRKVLHGLRDAGVIESTGRGRAAAWRRLT